MAGVSRRRAPCTYPTHRSIVATSVDAVLVDAASVDDVARTLIPDVGRTPWSYDLLWDPSLAVTAHPTRGPNPVAAASGQHRSLPTRPTGADAVLDQRVCWGR